MSSHLTSTKVANPLVELQTYRQSFWNDNISRNLIDSGALQRRIDEDGLRGVTSNPTIFEKAISGSTDYDASLKRFVKEGMGIQEIYEALVIDDIQRAADVLRPVFEHTHGQDGFVSLEVSPKLACRTQETIEEARRLWTRVNRSNVMIKVPATPEGIPAIEQLLGEGININITLMFSMKHYVQVAESYTRGLERLERAKKPLTVASVASFFVSRVDTLVDRMLEERLPEASSTQEREDLSSLLGKAAIANTKMVYQRFKEIFGSPRFLALKEKDARVQRPLWASTSTKNPKYRDVLYVEELIGPDTVNTMPPATIEAFRNHGVARPSLEENLHVARQVLEQLARLGIDMEEVGHRLQVEGVKLFADSFDALLERISAKRQVFRGA